MAFEQGLLRQLAAEGMPTCASASIPSFTHLLNEPSWSDFQESHIRDLSPASTPKALRPTLWALQKASLELLAEHPTGLAVLFLEEKDLPTQQTPPHVGLDDWMTIVL